MLESLRRVNYTEQSSSVECFLACEGQSSITAGWVGPHARFTIGKSLQKSGLEPAWSCFKAHCPATAAIRLKCLSHTLANYEKLYVRVRLTSIPVNCPFERQRNHSPKTFKTLTNSFRGGLTPLLALRQCAPSAPPS